MLPTTVTKIHTEFLILDLVGKTCLSSMIMDKQIIFTDFSKSI